MITRIPIMDVHPVVEGGAYPVKSVVDESFGVYATVFREGHDALGAEVVLTDPSGRDRPPVRMRPAGPVDRWVAEVAPDREGAWSFRVQSWSDPVGTWQHNAEVKIAAGVDVELMLAEGAVVLERAAQALPARVHRGPESRSATRSRRSRTPGARSRRGSRPAPRPRSTPCWRSARCATCGQQRALPRVHRPAPRAGRVLVRVLPPLRGRLRRRRRRRGRRGPYARRPSGCRRSPTWASTSSTCRRSTRSGETTARAPTTPSSPRRPIPARRGRSAPPRAVTTRSTPTSARSTTWTPSWRGPASSDSRWRSTSRCSAPPTTRGSRSTRSGSPPASTGRSLTPRTRRRSTRTSTR